MTTTATAARPVDNPRTGPSFAAALCGFIGTTTATTMVMILLGSL